MGLGSEPRGQQNFGLAWFLLCLAFCAYVADEALTGFLPIYNATVLAMRSQYKWFPMPTFEFRDWLTGLIIANIVLLLLTPFAFRNANGVSSSRTIFAMMSPVSQSRNSNVGIGNHLYWLRIARTVAL